MPRQKKPTTESSPAVAVDPAKELAKILQANERTWTLDERAARQRELGDLVSAAEKERDEHSDHLKANMALNDLEKAQYGRVVCSMITSERESYDPIKLMEAGVTIDQLEKGKVTTTVVQLRTSLAKE